MVFAVGEIVIDDDDDDEDEDLLQALPERFRRKYNTNDNNALSVPQHFATISHDDRPITPMKDKLVYGREYSSLDFKDG